MLKKTFEQTRDEIDKTLLHRDNETGETWHDFCVRRGFSVNDMLSGHDMVKRVQSRLRRLDQ